LSGNGFTEELLQENITKMCNAAETDYTGQYKNNAIKIIFSDEMKVVCMCRENPRKDGTRNA